MGLSGDDFGSAAAEGWLLVLWQALGLCGLDKGVFASRLFIFHVRHASYYLFLSIRLAYNGMLRCFDID